MRLITNILTKIGNVLNTKASNISKGLTQYTICSLLLELSLLPIGFLTTGTIYVALKRYFQCSKLSCYKYCMSLSLFSNSVLIGLFSAIGQSALTTVGLAKPALVPVVPPKSNFSPRTIIVIGFAISCGAVITPKLMRKVKNMNNKNQKNSYAVK